VNIKLATNNNKKSNISAGDLKTNSISKDPSATEQKNNN